MMKNKFLFLMMFLGVALFSSCSDDDDDDVVTYNGEKLALTINGDNWSGKEAVLDGEILTLKNVLPGEGEIALNVEKASGGKLTGKSVTSNRTLSVEGVVEKGVLTLAAVVEMNTSLTGTWQAGNLTTATSYATMSPLYVKVETEQLPIIFGKTSYDTVDEFEEAFHSLMIVSLSEMIKTITFEVDGNITAEYRDMTTNKLTKSPKGYALYNIVGDKLYVSVNVNKVMGAFTPGAKSVRNDMNPLDALMTVANTGIPLNMTILENGAVQVYLTRDFLMQFMGILDLVKGLIPEKIMGINLRSMVDEMVVIIQGSKKFELGMNLSGKK